jgi:chemotaxis protein CheY-P-specific phosphatase CheC
VKDYRDKALDVLREVCSMSTGRVATALSDLLKTRVDLSFPRAQYISSGKLETEADKKEKEFILETNIEGGVTGKFVLFLPPGEAFNLAAKLLGKPQEELSIGDDLFQSALIETMNIFAGSYSDVLCELTRLSLLYEVPFLHFGPRGEYFRSIKERYFGAEFLFSVDTLLEAQNLSFKGNLLLLLDPASIQKIFAALNQSELFLWAEIAKMKENEGGPEEPK